MDGPGQLRKKSAAKREYAPGTHAPSAGVYEQLNVFGAPTGLRVTMGQGEILPPAPHGCTWCIVESNQAP